MAGHAVGISAEDNEDIVPSGAKTYVFARGKSQPSQHEAQPLKSKDPGDLSGKSKRQREKEKKRKGRGEGGGGKKIRLGKKERQGRA